MRADTAATLFRGNTTATKLMTAFTRLTGRPYMLATLQSLMNEFMASNDGYEVFATPLQPRGVHTDR
jgi:hypothetical protein